MGIRHPTLRAQVARSRTTQLIRDQVVIGFAMRITTPMPEPVLGGPIVVVVNTKAAFPRQQTIVSVCHARLRALAIRI